MGPHEMALITIIVILCCVFIPIISVKAYNKKCQREYEKLISEVLLSLNLRSWMYTTSDFVIQLKSSKAVNDYTSEKFFKENREMIEQAHHRLEDKKAYATLLNNFLINNSFKEHKMYSKLEAFIQDHLKSLSTYNVLVKYRSPTGRSTNEKKLSISSSYVSRVRHDPSIYMGKGEYNKYLKEQKLEQLENKQHAFYEHVNSIIDLANEKRENLIIQGDQKELDRLISILFDRTVNSIKKIKSIESEEWDVIGKVIDGVEKDVDRIIKRNQEILDYYESDDFNRIKTTCDTLMNSQREFNEYIDEKARSISSLFGSRVVRNETETNDEYNYVRPYKKSITPFTAEVSATVFASAENNPLDYIVKYFYPNKSVYPEQIQKLQLLVEELETLREAKQIIENYKKDYQQYITSVPSFIMENDEDGFYSRLGFANVSESVLTVEYKFSYTSGGGMAQRSFSIPMTEETIVELINLLQSKLTMTAFAKEQRALMTSKLRQHIKERDNYTCKYCENSVFKEPNLLLEIDHIIPVAQGGITVENNLQTLCWKCNRQKGSKIIS